jgi:hypothetical protein
MCEIIDGFRSQLRIIRELLGNLLSRHRRVPGVLQTFPSLASDVANDSTYQSNVRISQIYHVSLRQLIMIDCPVDVFCRHLSHDASFAAEDVARNRLLEEVNQR